MTPLETRVPNTVQQQAVDRPVSTRVIVTVLADYGPYDPPAVREALEAAVESGDVKRVEGGYQPGEWDEYQPASVR